MTKNYELGVSYVALLLIAIVHLSRLSAQSISLHQGKSAEHLLACQNVTSAAVVFKDTGPRVDTKLIGEKFRIAIYHDVADVATAFDSGSGFDHSDRYRITGRTGEGFVAVL